MNDEYKSVEAVAKAAEEGFKTSGKLIDAGREAGSFLGSLVKEPLQELIGIATDNIRSRRWHNALEIEVKADAKIKLLGHKYKYRQLPLSVGVPLIEAMSLEETEELRELWANLTVNITNDFNPAVFNKSFISVLKEFSQLEASILKVIYQAPESLGQCILTAHLPNRIEYFQKEDESRAEPTPEVELALSNLFRQKCLETAKYSGGPDVYSTIYTTPFGYALFNAISFSDPTA